MKQELTVCLDRKNREEYVDLFRGFGIVMMVLVHVGFGWEIDKWVHSFHMPMFFIISGMFFYTSASGSFLIIVAERIKKHSKKLLLPYLFFGILSYLIWLVLCYSESGLEWYQPLVSLVWNNTRWMPISGSLWFLTAMFLCQIMFTVITALFSRKWVIVLMSAMISSAAVVISLFGIVLPWSLNAGMLGLGFMAVGWFIKAECNSKAFIARLIDLPLWAGLGLFVVFSVLAFVNSTVNMRSVSCGNVALFWLNAIGMSISMMNICCVIDKQVSLPALKSVLCIMKSVGMYSITYLCLNQLVLFLVEKYLIRFITPFLIHQVCCFILSLVILYFSDRLIRNTKLKVLIGM